MPSVLLVHGPLVKGLSLRLSGQCNTLECLSRLSIDGHTNIFPNLEDLFIIIETALPVDSPSGFFRVLVSPTIRALTISFYFIPMTDFETTSYTSALPDILRVVNQLQLRKLVLAAQGNRVTESQVILDEICELISNQALLDSVGIFDFPARLLRPMRAASRLEHLEELLIGVSKFPEDGSHGSHLSSAQAYPTVHQPFGFPALQRLDGAIAVRDFPNLLSSIQSTQLKQISVLLQQPGFTIARSLDGIGRLVGLQTIWVRFDHIRGEWPALQPLLSCHELREVTLHGERIAVTIGDAEVRAMAQAWPALRCLVITDCYLRRTRVEGEDLELGIGGEYPPAATLLGLLAFAEYCPFLTQLAIPIDAREMPGWGTITPPALGYRVTSLRFPDSWVDEREIRVANFLGMMWPNHEYPHMVGRRCEYDSGRDERWNKVWTLAQSVRLNGVMVEPLSAVRPAAIVMRPENVLVVLCIVLCRVLYLLYFSHVG